MNRSDDADVLYGRVEDCPRVHADVLRTEAELVDDVPLPGFPRMTYRRPWPEEL